jgi:hypothetical protein
MIIELILFVGSTGIFFNDEFRKKSVAVVAAGVIALGSTISLFVTVNDWVKDKPSTPAADEIFWLTVKDSAVLGLFEEFEKKYPTSPHLSEARSRIQQLKRDQISISQPTNPPPIISTPTTPKPLCVTFNNRQICE